MLGRNPAPARKPGDSQANPNKVINKQWLHLGLLYYKQYSLPERTGQKRYPNFVLASNMVQAQNVAKVHELRKGGQTNMALPLHSQST